jgi:hypothetical protein
LSRKPLIAASGENVVPDSRPSAQGSGQPHCRRWRVPPDDPDQRPVDFTRTTNRTTELVQRGSRWHVAALGPALQCHFAAPAQPD